MNEKRNEAGSKPVTYLLEFLKRLHKSLCLPPRTVTGKFTDFPVCVIRNIVIRKLLHLTISSPFISINQKHA